MRIFAAGLSYAALGCTLISAACSSDQMKMTGSTDAGSKQSGNTDTSGDGQTPATGAGITAWLESAVYKDWTCEPEAHKARSPSPHGFNRICSNDLIAMNATGTDDWPKGAAAVKELHPSASSTTPTGYAVYLKTQADSAGGASWYWYEIISKGNTKTVSADGLGVTGCVGCHSAAGSDADHTPSPGGRDQVYSPVH